MRINGDCDLFCDLIGCVRLLCGHFVGKTLNDLRGQGQFREFCNIKGNVDFYYAKFTCKDVL